jgi:hypothetical protein
MPGMRWSVTRDGDRVARHRVQRGFAARRAEHREFLVERQQEGLDQVLLVVDEEHGVGPGIDGWRRH